MEEINKAEKEQRIISLNKQLIEIYEQKTKELISKL